ncbi:MAG: CRISPR-associated endonuclease Cas3'' [Thermoprotei archaeon]|nr:MAG: CRISPR-associated endonuclease Cas3'' [Thermoprotei archaeon]
MVVYAWCGSRLKDHLVNTAKAVLKVRSLDRIAGVIAYKLSNYCSSAEGRISASEARELILLTLALHDIGKACRRYQESVILNGSECKASFRYHEVISAAIVAEALLPVSLSDPVRAVITLSVLNHHHALRDVKSVATTYLPAYHDVISESGPFIYEASKLPQEIYIDLGLRSPLVRSVVDSLVKVCRKSCNEGKLGDFISYLIAGIRGRPGGYMFLIRGVKRSYGGVTKYLVSALSGLISIADNLSAYCERSDRRNPFVNNLLNELNVTCEALL